MLLSLLVMYVNDMCISSIYFQVHNWMLFSIFFFFFYPVSPTVKIYKANRWWLFLFLCSGKGNVIPWKSYCLHGFHLKVQARFLTCWNICGSNNNSTGNQIPNWKLLNFVNTSDFCKILHPWWEFKLRCLLIFLFIQTMFGNWMCFRERKVVYCQR